MSENFNPSEYKDIKGMPEDEQDNFVEVGEGGFVKKEAAEPYLEAIIEKDPTILEKKLTEMAAEARKINRNRDDLLKKIEEGSSNIFFVPEEFRDDKAVVLAIAGQWGEAIEDVSERLKDDEDVARAAVEDWGLAISYVSERLKNDRDIVYTAVQSTGSALYFVPPKYQSDSDIVRAAVQNYSFALQYASEALKNDRDIVYTAVQNDGLALQFASPELKNDKDLVRLAVQKSEYAIRVASPEIQCNLEFLIEIFKINPKAIIYAPDTIQEKLLKRIDNIQISFKEKND